MNKVLKNGVETGIVITAADAKRIQKRQAAEKAGRTAKSANAVASFSTIKIKGEQSIHDVIIYSSQRRAFETMSESAYYAQKKLNNDVVDAQVSSEIIIRVSEITLG